jgi:transcriptional regulator with XRE-family HTH domain
MISWFYLIKVVKKMTTGERIKQRRLELKLSVDEVANRLGKNRATIYRYESDDIENLPTTVLEPLSIILDTTPAQLMGWDKSKQLSDEINIVMDISNANIHYKNQRDLIEQFDKLNFKGEEEAVKRVRELTLLSEYTENQASLMEEIPDSQQPSNMAAHLDKGDISKDEIEDILEHTKFLKAQRNNTDN